MAGVVLSDVIVPDVWTPYTVQRTMELSAVVQSGIVESTPFFDNLASSAGSTANMPFWGDLAGASENVTEATVLAPDGITAGQDTAIIFRRARMWSSTDLSASLSGSDPAGVIANLAASYWARDLQAELIAILGGAMSAASMASNVHDISGGAGAAAVWSGSAFIDAVQRLGDAKDQLAAVVMHSMTETLLQKQNLITYIQPTDGGDRIATYMNKRVIIDDSCPVAAGVYTTYIFGAGAVALGNGNPAGFVATEIDRDKRRGSGIDYLVNRKTLILHPRGIAFTGTPANPASPTRAELGTAGNWTRRFDSKAIRIVAFRHRIA